MSLKEKLNNYIRDQNGSFVSHDMIKQLCQQFGYRESNAERRLRASESPNIERVYKNGAIIGYKWKQSENVRDFMEKWGPKPIEENKVKMLF